MQAVTPITNNKTEIGEANGFGNAEMADVSPDANKIQAYGLTLLLKNECAFFSVFFKRLASPES